MINISAMEKTKQHVKKKNVILGAGAAAIAGLAAAGSYGAFRMAFCGPGEEKRSDYCFPTSGQYAPYRESNIERVKSFSELPWEAVETVSFDGLRLTGRYLHFSDISPTAICFHGWHGTALRDFCGGGPIIRDLGFNLLLVDERAHGNSEGSFQSLGILERRDVLSWIDYAIERSPRKDPKIALYGISMGAATVLMASGMNLPENVKMIAADCPYSSVEAIIKKVSRDRGLPSDASWIAARLSAKMWGGFDPKETDCMVQTANCRLPILLIHGAADKFVPCDMSLEIFDAAVTGNRAKMKEYSDLRQVAEHSGVEIRREVFPDAGHGISYLVDTPRYQKVLKDFVLKHM